MEKADFTLQLSANKPPQQIFEAITQLREWWSGYYAEEIEGTSENLNDEFTFRAGSGVHYSKQKVVELIPNKRMVWLITESDLSFLKHPTEWTGTKILFEIAEHDGQAQLRFTHQGLKPEAECYDACAPAWTQYLQNKLHPLINTNAPAHASA